VGGGFLKKVKKRGKERPGRGVGVYFPSVGEGNNTTVGGGGVGEGANPAACHAARVRSRTHMHVLGRQAGKATGSMYAVDRSGIQIDCEIRNNLSLFPAFNLCIEYSVRYLTSGVKLIIQLRQHRIEMSSN